MTMNKVEFNPKLATHGSKSQRLRQRIWEIARFFLFLGSPWFARGWRLFWIRLFSGGGYERGVSLARTCRIDFPWNVAIGEFSSVGYGTLIRGSTKISIGKNCCISEGVKILTAGHDVTSPFFDLTRKPVEIHDSVWIAMDAIILPGVTIGEGAVVAAGAVVTKDVEPFTVVGGNPAKFIKNRVLSDVVNG